MKKIFSVALGISMLFSSALPLTAQSFSNFDDIDGIMQSNALTEISNRYAGILLSYYPERATLLGFESSNNKLDLRDAERDARALRALEMLKTALEELDYKALSVDRQTDYITLLGNINMDIFNIESNQLTKDPLYYSNALNSVYDLLIKPTLSAELQDRDMIERAMELKDTLREAKRNLTAPPTFLSQLATEQAYYGFLSFDEIPTRLLTGTKDEVTRHAIRNNIADAKKNIRGMFDYFKELATTYNNIDFRLGAEKYTYILNNKYFITKKTKDLDKYLEEAIRAARIGLYEALEPYAINENETIVVEGDEQPAKQPSKPRKVTKKTILPTAKDFYAVAKKFQIAPPETNLLANITAEAQRVTKMYVENETLPEAETSYNIQPLPGYFAHTVPYLFVPPYGTQTTQRNDFYVRLPSGNATNKAKMLQQDFNRPTVKLMLAGQLVPGVYYQSILGREWPAFRKLYPVKTLQNGWIVYAQHLAKERGYLTADQDKLFLAFADYKRAVAAWIDFQLNTKALTYNGALEHLAAVGFEQDEAESIIKNIAREPGDAISYLVGYDALKNVRAKTAKKQGKKFLLPEFHKLLISVGNVPPDQLEQEVERAYKNNEQSIDAMLNAAFYM